MVLNLPALLVGLIVGFYWARVIKLVLKARRQTGRDANFVPREPLGLALRTIWYPTVVIWVFHPLLSGFFGNLFPLNLPGLRPIYYHPVLAWLAVAVAFAALAATMVCWRRMGKSWRMGIDPGEKTQLIVTGPYAYVRHPIYGLSSLLMLASMAVLPSPLMLVAGLFHLFFLQWEARREEMYLVRTHGEDYANYMRHTGRFMPESTKPFVQS